jgi:hypothetical protein
VQARAQAVLPELEKQLLAEPRERPLISIACPPRLELLEPTHAYLSAYCSTCLPPAVAQRLNVGIYELCSNALRYGATGHEVQLELRRTAAGSELWLENGASAEHSERLAQQVARVKRDAETVFAEEMGRIATGTALPMLGLVRLVHESALELELELEGSLVRVTALCRH